MYKNTGINDSLHLGAIKSALFLQPEKYCILKLLFSNKFLFRLIELTFTCLHKLFRDGRSYIYKFLCSHKKRNPE